MAADMLARWCDARRRILRHGARRPAVHAWRISSRQLQALEELLAPSVTGPHRAALGRRLHEAFHASGQLRDGELAAARLEQLAPRFPAATRLARDVRRDLDGWRTRVVKRVRAIEPRALRAVVESWELPRQLAAGRIARRAQSRLARAARRLEKLHVRRPTTRSLHRYRVQLKLLRYMTDLGLAAGMPMPHEQAALPRMVRLQRRLGEIVDIQVLLKMVERFGRKHPHWRRKAAPLADQLRKQRARLVGRLPEAGYHAGRYGNYLWEAPAQR